MVNGGIGGHFPEGKQEGHEEGAAVHGPWTPVTNGLMGLRDARVGETLTGRGVRSSDLFL